MNFECVIDFWFDELDSDQWWQKDAALDRHIERRFADVHRQAVQAETVSWRSESLGRLAEIIVLDQFSRNIYRHHSEAFRYDGQALVLAQEAVSLKADKDLTPIQQSMLYMPFMHSESPAIHQQAVELFKSCGIQTVLDFEHEHKQIIDRFGRYPHRNAVLGRASTAVELEYLSQAGAGF